MSSYATAPSRMAEQDPHTPPALDDQRVESALNQGQTLDEVQRVERLLTQLEARSMALVPYGYGAVREVPSQRSNSVLVAGVLVAIWLTTLILGLVYLRLLNHTPVVSERTAVTAPLIIPPEADPQEQKVASSVDHLARALVSSSERMNQLQAAMERNNRDLQRIASKVGNDRAAASSNVTAKTEAASAAVAPAAVAEDALPKNWHKVLEIRPTGAAVAHRAADGTIDYWLVPRGPEQSLNKVLPIGTSTDGVVVHNLEDGKDYTITPMGEWRNGSLSQPGSN